MAEMNQLLEQAIQECEGLTAEAESFGSALGGLDGQVSSDERRILKGARDKLNAMQQELANLRAQDAKADAADEELRQRLADGDEVLAETEEKARQLLEEARAGLQDIRAERERIGAALKEGTQRAHDELNQLRERLGELEEAAEERLDQAEGMVERIEDAVRDAVGYLQRRTSEIGEQLDEAAGEVGRQADDITTAQDTLGARTGTAVAHCIEGAERASGLALSLLGDFLGLKLSEALQEKTGRLTERIGELSGLAEAGQGRLSEVQALTDQFARMQEALTSMMELMQGPMAALRNAS